MGTYLNHNSLFNSGDDHASVRVFLLQSGDLGFLLCYQAESIAAVNLKTFWTSAGSFLKAVSRNTSMFVTGV